MKKSILLAALCCSFAAPAAFADTDSSGFQTGQDEGLFQPEECTAKNATSCTGEDPSTDIISKPPKPYGKQGSASDSRPAYPHHHFRHGHGHRTVVIRELPSANF